MPTSLLPWQLISNICLCILLRFLYMEVHTSLAIDCSSEQPLLSAVLSSSFASCSEFSVRNQPRVLLLFCTSWAKLKNVENAFEPRVKCFHTQHNTAPCHTHPVLIFRKWLHDSDSLTLSPAVHDLRHVRWIFLHIYSDVVIYRSPSWKYSTFCVNVSCVFVFCFVLI